MGIPVIRPFQGAPARLQDRVTTTDQNLLVPSAVNSFTAKVYDQSTGSIIKTLTVDPADVFSALQTGNGWSRDSVGYNFEYVLAGDAFAHEGGKQYRVEFHAVTTAEPVKWAWIVHYQVWMGTR